jgi:repressor LexA
MTRDREMEERLHRILEFLSSFQEKSGYSPSIREIGDKIGVKSTSLVDFYLEKLEARGAIVRDKHISRSIRVLSKSLKEVFRIPVLGRIVAGEPIPIPGSDLDYFNSEDSVEIASSILPSRERAEDLFALQVQGNSMVDAMVNDGDIVIMKPTRIAENGDMVAVWLPDRDETTLKYFYKEGDRYRLQPANPTMAPIFIERSRPLEIMGKVVMVLRQVHPAPLAA